MTTGTNVPPPQFTNTGLVVPTQAAVLAGVQADINAAFGGNLNFALNTPQGQLASSMAAALSAVYSLFAYWVNGLNPNSPVAFLQDIIGFIYFITRISGTPTAVECTCTGLPGTPLLGAQAVDTSNNLYECVDNVNIPSSGSVVVTFENVVNGPVPCGAGTLNRIYQQITGWDTVNNADDGEPGSNVESPGAFGFRYENSVQVNSQGFLGSIYSALAELVGAQNVYCTENDTNGTVDTGTTDYPLVAHSIYVAVVGGTPAEIAQIIFTKKSPGCNYNGNTTEVVYDTSYPAGDQPAYSITYNVPNDVAITFTIDVVSSSSLPSNLPALIAAAIIAQFETGNAALSLAPQGIASNIIAANYVAAVLSAYPAMTLLSVQVGTAFAGLATLTNGSPNLVVTSVTSGFLAVGDIVAGTDIPANTSILSGPAGGGTGTYVMSANATATVSSPEAVTSTGGNLAQYQCGIDQAPSLAAVNVVVNEVG